MTDWKEQYVRITKTAAQANAKFPTPDLKDFEPGGRNHGMSIPLDYWSEGYLLAHPKQGGVLFMDRRVRNGVQAYGIFQSSEITNVTELPDGSLQVDTQNSTYLINKVEDNGIATAN